MKQFFVSIALLVLPLSNAFAAPVNHPGELYRKSKITSVRPLIFHSASRARQNLIGEVTSIDAKSGKVLIQTEAKTTVTVTVNDKTAFRRVSPGQTSLANAEQITLADIKIGDRVLIPGGVANEQTPARQLIVMAREAITAKREQERETQRARTVSGRVTAIDAEKKEITIQARGRGAEAMIVAAAGKAKLLRYAPDSLKIGDAAPGSFADLRVGDQIRVVGDRSTDGTRVTAEEIVSGSITRIVGSILEINAARGEIVVKNSRTGELSTIAVGKKTTLRRISPEVAAALRERAERRQQRRSERASNDQQPAQGQNNERRNRGERRNGADGEPRAGNRNPQQMFENLPAVTVAELKKGDAVLITGTSSGGGNNSRLTAVSIITGAADLQELLQRTQGGRNNSSNMSPGLPGNVSGGNAGGSDDEPRE